MSGLRLQVAACAYRRACKGLLSRSASGARTEPAHTRRLCALRSHHFITLRVARVVSRGMGLLMLARRRSPTAGELAGAGCTGAHPGAR